MKQLMIAAAVLVLAVPAMADTFAEGTANEFTIDFVTISGATNPTSGYGIVNKDYRMGKYEITNAQWNKFKAAYGAVTGTPSTAYDTDPYFPGLTVPTNSTSWYEAAQFVNYLNTSTGHTAAYKFIGTQGTGDYTFTVWDVTDAGYNANNTYRNSNAKYFLPTEDEWVKAAYWNGTNLQTYANASAGDLVSGSPDPAKWNYYPSVGNEPWNATSGVHELNGTHNMMGNILEFMERPTNYGLIEEPTSDSYRIYRGGSCDSWNINTLGSSYLGRHSGPPDIEATDYGFRVASIPEPCTILLLGIGSLLIRKRTF